MVVRRGISGSVAAAALVLLSCGDSLPSGLGADEIGRLSVRQGVAGRLAVRTGTCGALPGTCRVYAPAAVVRAISITDGGERFGVTGEGCKLGDDDLPLFGREMVGVLGQDGTIEGDVYSIGLSPGNTRSCWSDQTTA